MSSFNFGESLGLDDMKYQNRRAINNYALTGKAFDWLEMFQWFTLFKEVSHCSDFPHNSS